jgi:hypothetical protein
MTTPLQRHSLDSSDRLTNEQKVAIKDLALLVQNVNWNQHCKPGQSAEAAQRIHLRNVRNSEQRRCAVKQQEDEKWNVSSEDDGIMTTYPSDYQQYTLPCFVPKKDSSNLDEVVLNLASIPNKYRAEVFWDLEFRQREEEKRHPLACVYCGRASELTEVIQSTR